MDNFFSKRTKTDFDDGEQVIKQTSASHSEDENPASVLMCERLATPPEQDPVHRPKQ